tara:strand:- start:461 stop:1465 length:1005 start_codon:yes stop_codon:yes gene_type:complete
MSPLKNCIVNKETKNKPIWIMRQAGRYLPEFREIRKKNPNFIELCLNENLSSEITLQPIKRFNLDAAIIFSDILMLPFGLNQNVNFIKNFGPELGDFKIEEIKKISENNFKEKLLPIYNSINITSKNELIKNKDLIGFVGAPWTLLLYMINKKSPKNKIKNDFFSDNLLINQLLEIIQKFLKIHIKNQIENGATIIQIFDSWAGLLEKKNFSKFIYDPTENLVNYTKSLGVPVICFPKGIKNYKEYCEIVKPDVISIDYEVDPKLIRNQINIPVQGGLDPKVLLTEKENIKKNVLNYLNIFKDHPYIFNLGHGVLPETNPEDMSYLVEIVNNFK